MHSRQDIELAVDLQQRSYRLLRWLSGALGRGFISVHHASDVVELPDIALDWIRRNICNFPPDSRPGQTDGAYLAAYARFFASYLVTSFDLIDGPGQRRVSSCCGACSCRLCSYLVDLPNLRPKHIMSSDKKRAKKLISQYLRQLALDVGASLDASSFDAIAADSSLTESLALATYGFHLIRRMQGEIEGPALLVLWRQFAWLPTGSPKKHFSLRATDILDAEARLTDRVKGWPGSEPERPPGSLTNR